MCWSAAAAMAIAACGGGDDARSVLSGASEPETTEVAPTDPPVTDPAVTDPPVSEPPVTDPPGTDPADEPPATVGADTSAGDLAAFCGASEQFYVEARALREIGGDDDAAARSLFSSMNVSVSGAIFNAPSEELAAAPTRVQELLDLLLPALDTVDYDIDAIGTLDNATEVDDAFTEFGTILDQLEAFLVSDCNSDLDMLAESAIATAAAVGNDLPPSDNPVTSEDPSGDPVPDAGTLSDITDDSGTISVSVPAAWTEVDGAPDGDIRQLVAAPDAAAFLAAFDSPGVIIIAGDTDPGRGTDAGAAGLAGLVSSVEADGCELTSEDAYDDGVYVGSERIYRCPGTDAVSRFAGGTNSEENIFWLVGVIYEPGDVAVWNNISETFLVD